MFQWYCCNGTITCSFFRILVGKFWLNLQVQLACWTFAHSYFRLPLACTGVEGLSRSCCNDKLNHELWRSNVFSIVLFLLRSTHSPPSYDGKVFHLSLHILPSFSHSNLVQYTFYLFKPSHSFISKLSQISSLRAESACNPLIRFFWSQVSTSIHNSTLSQNSMNTSWSILLFWYVCRTLVWL